MAFTVHKQIESTSDANLDAMAFVFGTKNNEFKNGSAGASMKTGNVSVMTVNENGKCGTWLCGSRRAAQSISLKTSCIKYMHGTTELRKKSSLIPANRCGPRFPGTLW